MSDASRWDGIAIVGMACRFPGAPDLGAYWRNLVNGVESIRRLDEETLRANGVPPEVLADPRYVKAAPVLGDVAGFDAAFFGTPPREARLMDPQHRLFLETAWHAFEDAGYRPDAHPGLVGVWAGAGGVVSSYLVDRLRATPEILGATGELEHIVNDKDFLPTRVSYLLDLRGPSVNVQTACSTSAVAVHLACQSLLDGECDLALAGASVVRVPHHAGYLYQETGILSPDGHCRAFDARAQGTVFGSGVGAVLLKPLDRATADGDHVYAVIKGSAVNNDGGAKVSYTASSQEGQARAATEALAFAEVDARSLGYVEAHGTGTLMGDPLEIQALTRAFRQTTSDTGFCAVASVKSNLGHLEQAAGIAGLIKAALALHHRQIPASLHFERPNPKIDFERGPFYVSTELADWPAGDAPRRAGVNSLGLGGTNAFLVLEEAPPVAEAASEARAPYVLPLSARSDEALATLAERTAEHLTEHPELPPADVCFTAGAGRAPFARRRAAVGSSLAELASDLARKPAASPGGPVAFLFSGQGAQVPGMARELYATRVVFRQTFDECDRLLRPTLGESLAALLWPEEGEEDLDQTGLTQPALFAVEVSLARLLESWSVVPGAVLGHSVGELAAAHVAGAMSLEDAATLVAERARLMQSLPEGGGMLAIRAGEDVAREAIAGAEQVSIAAVNSPESTVVAGPLPALETVAAELDRRGVESRALRVSHAFHSPLMDPILAPLEAAASGLSARPLAIPMASNLTGALIEAGDAGTLDAGYWRRHAREPVRFEGGVRALHDAGFRTFVEIGPGKTLLGLASQCVDVPESEPLAWLPTLVRGRDDEESLASTVAALWEGGADVDWAAFSPVRGRRVSLPTYPFEHRHYWLEGDALTARARAATDAHPLLGGRLRSPLEEAQFEAALSLDALPYLSDHRMYALPVLPTTATLEMAATAARATFGAGSHALESLIYQQALIVPEAARDAVAVQLVVDAEDSGRAAFRLLSQGPGADTWRLHMTGTMVRRGEPAPDEPDADRETRRRRREDLRSAAGDAVAYYREIGRAGLEYGPRFQGIRELWRRDGEALARVRLPDGVDLEPDRYHAHPALLDACLHLYAALVDEYFPGDGDDGSREPVFLPVSLERCELLAPLPRDVWSHARRRPASDHETLIADLEITGDDGEPLATLTGLMLRRLDRETLLPPAAEVFGDWLYRFRWRARSRPQAKEVPAAGWLILADVGGLGEALARQLEAQGQRSLVALADAPEGNEDGIAAEGPGRWRVDPTRPDALRRLLDQALSPDTSCRGVVYLWGLDAPATEELTAASLAEGQRRATGGALHLAQALAVADPAATRELRLWLVTRGVHQPTGDPPRVDVGVAQAPLWGLGRTIAQELPILWGGLIDLTPATRPLNDDAFHLAGELLADPGDDQIVLAADRRWVARLERLELPAAPPAPIREDGAYLITGGLGALGLAVARYLVERGARHLALTGRSVPRDAAAAAIAELEEQGATVTFARADVAAAEQVAELLATLRAAGRPLAGVVHCAGILDDATLGQLDWPRFERVTAAKVQGAWNLHLSSLEDDLDLFVVFSSVLALTGSAGQANYTAANAFLDALAACRRGRGLPALAIGWGPWAEAGLAVSAGRRGEEVWRARGTTYIPPEPGIAVLDHLLRHDLGHAAVTITDWSTFVPQLPARSRAFYEELATAPDAAAGGSDLLAELATAAPAERRRLLFERLRSLLAELLGVEPGEIEPDRPFVDYGFDSLMAVQLRNRLAQLELAAGLEALSQATSLTRLAAEVRTKGGVAIDDLAPADGAEPDDGPETVGRPEAGRAEIVPFELEHLPAIQRFSDRVWQRPAESAFTDWRYRRCAAFHRAWLALEGGECLATVSAFEKTYLVDGEHRTVLEGFDWFSLPELQTSGVGIEVMEALQREPHPVVGIGGTDEAVALRKRLGWRRVADAQGYLLPLPGAAARVGKRVGVPAPLARLALAIARVLWLRPRRRKAPRGGQARQVRRFDPEIETLYDGDVGYRAVQKADPGYLNWLIDAYPGMGTYLPFLFNVAGTLRGWALGRVYPSEDGVAASLVDCFAPRPTADLYTWMVSEVLLHLAAFAPASVRAAATCPLLGTALRRNRFLKWRRLPVDCWSRGETLPAEGLHLTLDVADEAFLPYPVDDERSPG